MGSASSVCQVHLAFRSARDTYSGLDELGAGRVSGDRVGCCCCDAVAIAAAKAVVLSIQDIEPAPGYRRHFLWAHTNGLHGTRADCSVSDKSFPHCPSIPCQLCLMGMRCGYLMDSSRKTYVLLNPSPASEWAGEELEWFDLAIRFRLTGNQHCPCTLLRY
jgi:hypothetical protein